MSSAYDDLKASIEKLKDEREQLLVELAAKKKEVTIKRRAKQRFITKLEAALKVAEEGMGLQPNLQNEEQPDLT